MDWLKEFLQGTPEITLFICLALGYLVGKLRVGPIQLGGICGTLIVALLVGLIGVSLNDEVKNIAFALFIFALGFTGGPQFFANFNSSGLRMGLLSVIEMVSVVVLVLIIAGLAGLDVGTASGILAGAATESAVVGTATEAIGNLGLSGDQTSVFQSNVATAYTVCYLFGLVTIVLFTSGLAPVLMRINLRESAAALLRKMGGGDDDPGEAPAAPRLVGRDYRVSAAAGRTVAQLEAALPARATVEKVSRDGKPVDVAPDLALRDGDLVLVVGERAALVDAENVIGEEQAGGAGLDMELETRHVVVTRKDVEGRSIGDLRDNELARTHGVFLTGLSRTEQHLDLSRGTRLHRGDELTVTGATSDLDRVTTLAGYAVPRTITTDFVYLGLGVTIGMLIGQLSIRIGDVPLSLGTGGGALLAGLVFGWFRSRHQFIGNFPPAAAAMTKDLGLATFIAATGLTAGPQAGPLLAKYGVLLPFCGIGMVLVPALISLFVGRKLLKLEPPILIGAIAGQQCSTPAITAITNVAGNSVPLIGYTVTYAMSSILLPLTGPIVVGLIGG
ncbi:aspartate-alanine antiporter [Actinophytocola xinjiangensis]|uniref:Aspartate-alanine antiporter n=1 Tax=Actinophytocola xinjiangensis TaxID=485602 RepID=A0A7Z0WJL4_9PSEU|nr:aspartate-alanine antiporter [Actinophytocola xinjiangensis]OLF08064.1 aspartate-alanine antiporter [Actinophytocola xinjiangensis]